MSSFKRSQSRKIVGKIADLLMLGVSADRINPVFTPKLRWAPAEKLSAISGLTVNVAMTSVTSRRATRAHLGVNFFVGIQVLKKITQSVEADFDNEVDDLVALCEWMNRWLMRQDNASFLTDENETYSIQEVSIAEHLDWQQLEEKRTFHSVLAVNVYRLQEAAS